LFSISSRDDEHGLFSYWALDAYLYIEPWREKLEESLKEIVVIL
jgi:hypothetical protein